MLLTMLQKFAFGAEVSFQSPAHASSFPTSVQAACLQQIANSAFTKFDETCPEHIALLHRLWSAWFSMSEHENPTTPPPMDIPSELWRDIGFQSPNPISDIRGGAELCMRNMTYFAETYPHTLRQLRKNKTRRAREMKHEVYPSFPIAPAGINITRTLTEIFNIVEPLSGKSAWFCQLPTPYYRFVAAESSSYVDYDVDLVRNTAGEEDADYFKMGEKAFNEIFCFVLQYLDHKWDIENASYMDFNRILKQVKEELVHLLSSAPPHATLWWLRLHTGLFIHAHDFTPFSEKSVRAQGSALTWQRHHRS
jgi:hypothetical protein